MNPFTLTLKPYVALATGAVRAAFAGWAVVTHLELQTARANLTNLTTQLASAKVDNDSNVATIATQRAALATWVNSAEEQLAAAKAAAAQVTRDQVAAKLVRTRGEGPVLTRTVTETVQVEKMVPVPAELTVDCKPAALEDTTIGGTLARLASVEVMLAVCRQEIAMIRKLH